MATLTGGNPEDVRRVALSPRPKGRGCVFNHDQGKAAAPQNPPESSKKHLNVDSPSFTPSSLAVNGQLSKSSGLSPKAAIAAPFKPKGIASAATAPSFTPSLKQYNPNAPDWIASAPEIPEFLPQSYNTLSIIQPYQNDIRMAGNPYNRRIFNDMQENRNSLQTPQRSNQPLLAPPLLGHLHGHGQATPPRVFGNVPLYGLGPHYSSYQSCQAPTPSLYAFPQPNVLRPNAQSFYPRPSPALPLSHPGGRMINPLQLGTPGLPIYNSVTPGFPSFHNISSSSPHVRQNYQNMPRSPFISATNPIQSGMAHLNQPFPNAENNPENPHPNPFDQYATNTPSIASTSHTPQPQVNPYAQDAGSLGVPSYFQGPNSYTQPLQHHLYAAWGPYPEPLNPNQRTAKDLFIPEDLRQALLKKTEATLATFPNSTLPSNIAYFHTLVPLVHNTQKTAALFGYSSWVYKAMSSNDGKVYCLRRLQGYRLTNDPTNETAIRSIQQNWKRVRNGNVVNVHLAFTNSGFGDSSLIFVTDYHPCSETLAQKHFNATRSGRNSNNHVSEQILWGYIVQIASALKAIHSAGLAARVIDPSKVLLTSESRVRLNACAIMDVVQHNSSTSMNELQCKDLDQFGRLIHAIGTNNHSVNTTNQTKVTDAFSRFYSAHLRDSVNWLLNQDSGIAKTIDAFLTSIATDVVNVFDSSLHLDDQLVGDLNRELENSRIVRLLAKLNFINERPEYEHDQKWAEHGVRYILVLFRDYVFHQVDEQGNPVLDLAHVLTCCNKLDVGIDEKITLTSRDENTVVIVSFREVKNAVEAAWSDLVRRAGLS